MEAEKSIHYLPIRHSEEGEAFLSDTSSLPSSDHRYESERHSKTLNSYRAALPWLLHAILLSLSASFLVVSLAVTRSNGEDCIRKLSEYCISLASGSRIQLSLTNRISSSRTPSYRPWLPDYSLPGLVQPAISVQRPSNSRGGCQME